MYQEIREFKKITMGSATVVCQILSLAKRKTKLSETWAKELIIAKWLYGIIYERKRIPFT